MNTNPNHSSITFYCPIHLKTSFDELVKFKRISRTSIINYLMEQYVRSEHKLMEEDTKMVTFINDIKLRSHKNNPPKINKNIPIKNERSTKWSVEEDDYYEAPMIQNTNDRSWDDYLKDTNQREDWSDISGVGFLDRLGR